MESRINRELAMIGTGIAVICCDIFFYLLKTLISVIKEEPIGRYDE